VASFFFFPSFLGHSILQSSAAAHGSSAVLLVLRFTELPSNSGPAVCVGQQFGALMSALKLLSLAVLLLSNAQAAPACEADDSALLQEKTLSHVTLGESTQAKANAKIPDLSALKDAFGSVVDKVADFANKGVEQVTDKLGTVLGEADKGVLEMAKKCNASLKAFDDAADLNASVGENITRLKTLVGSTLGKLGPLYDSTSKQVSSGFDTAKTLLKPIGLDDEAEKLGKCAESAADHLSTLKEKAAAALGELQEVTEDTLDPALDKMTTQLEDAKSTAADFAGKFDETFSDFVASFTKAVTGKLPAGQQETLGAKIESAAKSMTDKVHLLSVHLQSMVEDVSAGAAKSAQSIRKDVKEVTSPGFFGSIGNFFKNLFR